MVFSFSSNFHDMKKVMPNEYGEMKISFWIRKKGQLAFSEGQQQLVYSGNTGKQANTRKYCILGRNCDNKILKVPQNLETKVSGAPNG